MSLHSHFVLAFIHSHQYTVVIQPTSIMHFTVQQMAKSSEQIIFITSQSYYYSCFHAPTGLGSAILEQLREDYPLAYILSVAVAPFSLGETPLQHYNTLLCLSWQQKYSDAVLLFQNDYVLEQAQKSAGGKRGTGRPRNEGVSVEEMNRCIGQTLCNSFLPIWSAKQR